MSRVFLAEEARLSREIQLAACLQHPHIVSLPTAGPSQDESFALARSYKRLGELYEAKRDRERLGRLAQESGT
jgi:hypothetical protein